MVKNVYHILILVNTRWSSLFNLSCITQNVGDPAMLMLNLAVWPKTPRRDEISKICKYS